MQRHREPGAVQRQLREGWHWLPPSPFAFSLPPPSFSSTPPCLPAGVLKDSTEVLVERSLRCMQQSESWRVDSGATENNRRCSRTGRIGRRWGILGGKDSLGGGLAVL